MNRRYKQHVRLLINQLLLCVGVLTALNAYSLGLGTLEHTTYLGEALDAQIQILGSENIAPDNIKVRNLSARDASELGVDLLYSPYRYRLSPILENGVLKSIRLQSREDIIEPYVNVLIELRWPTGSVLREYALLFDTKPLPPPRKKGQTASAVESPQSAEAMTLSTSYSMLDVDADYVVQPGDTLSGIVARVQLPEGVTSEQALSSIFAANPAAFQDQNINSLKAGVTLRLPSQPSLESIVAEQAKAIPRQEPVSAIDSESVGIDDGDRVGRLTLSDSSTRNSGDVVGPYTDSPEFREQIDGTQEMIDLLIKENQELRERIENIESSEYMNTLSQLVAMQRQQIKSLQDSIGQQGNVDFALVSSDGGFEQSSVMPASGLDTDMSASASLNEILLANFWLFIGLVVLGFLMLVALAFYAIRTLGSRRATLAADRSYNEAASFVENDLDQDLPVSYGYSASQERENAAEDRVIEPIRVEQNVSTIGEALEEKRRGGATFGKTPKQLEKDEEVKARIRQKTEDYNALEVSSQAPSRISDVEIDVLVGVDEEINELLSMAKIYCSAGKYSEARAILSAQNEAESDPRLHDALLQIEEMERDT